MHWPTRLALAATPIVAVAVLAWRASAETVVDLGTLPPSARARLAANQALLSRTRIADNLAALGLLVAREAPDIVALQEADGPSAWSGRFDHVSALASFAEYPHLARGDHAEIGKLPLDYGTALLGRLPLEAASSHAFQRSWRDTKGWVVATVTIPGLDGIEIDVVSVHLDFLRGWTRSQQVDRMVEALAPRERPLVVLGDLNCEHGTEPMSRLVDGLGLHAYEPADGDPTFPSTSPRRRLDWILVSEELRVVSHRTLPDAVSDHRAVVAEIALAP
ncbi:MAG: endonuclease/exonuclease/phosphatase family protein [Deltaproteobacteria bacterium]|nr:endonuclease/exonuclease/phosphatase family protein [Deltaproteobacteria bacterium]